MVGIDFAWCGSGSGHVVFILSKKSYSTSLRSICIFLRQLCFGWGSPQVCNTICREPGSEVDAVTVNNMDFGRNNTTTRGGGVP